MKTKLLLLLLLANFSIYAQTNLVPNGGFEKWTSKTTLSDWTTQNNVNQNTADYWEGFNSAMLSFTNSALIPKITTQVPLNAGVTYVVKFKYKYLSSNYNNSHPIVLNISKNGSSTTLSNSFFAVDNNWTTAETTFTPDQNLSYDLSISLNTLDNIGFNANIDYVQIYAQEGTEQYTLIPDLNFEKKLIAIGIDSGTPDGKVLTSSISTITNLNVTTNVHGTGLYITDLTGIQDFTALTSLNCSGQEIATLNLTKNTALTTLNCLGNLLTSLDISKNQALTSINCSNNKLTNLDVSAKLGLTNLQCSSNKLTSLDVSKNIALIYLSCSNNAITNLDVSKNIALTSFYCSNNPLISLNVKNGNNTAFYWDFSYHIDFSITTQLYCISVDDVIYSNKNWSTFKNFRASYTLACDEKYTLIPDPKFEQKLRNLYIDSGEQLDGKVLTASISSLKTLDVSGAGMTDLTGIEDFAQLTTLNCSGNSITKVDISKNLALTTFNCYNNKLKSLNISKNLKLVDLNCGRNQLTALDVTKNTALTNLNCSYNTQFASLDFSKNIALAVLDCRNTNLRALNLVPNVNLADLNCSNNFLTVLDLPDSWDFKTLDCSNNRLPLLDVSKNTNLSYFNCSNNKLTSLDVSKNNSLTTFYCNTNKLVNLNVKNGTNTILKTRSFKDNWDLKCISVDNVSTANANWSSSKETVASYNTNCGQAIAYTLIPDANFEQKLIDIGIDTDGKNGKVLTENIVSLTSLDLSSANIASLVGIQDFVSLTYLDCGRNKIANLDFSQNVALTTLYCSNNYLETLSVVKNIFLTYLDCKSNRLKKLDVSNNTALTYLDVSYNSDFFNFPELDVTKNTTLTTLKCSDLDLTVLDISKNLSLTTLVCDNNKIEYIDVSKHTSLTKLNCRSNRLWYLNLKNGNNKNLDLANSDFRYNNNLACIKVDDATYSTANWSSKKDETASFNEACNENYTLIPDINFEKKLIALKIDVGEPDGKIPTARISFITYINLNNASITDLTGIQDFVSLTNLICESNQLTRINLSQNVALVELMLNNNKLTSIDISNNKALESLEISKNELTSLDISNNTNLKSLFCMSNKLTTLDVSKNKKLRDLRCASNQLTNLDLSSNPLWTINCSKNNLSTLNLKNGLNKYISIDIINLNLTENPLLKCIQVDDADYSTINWAERKDPGATFNKDCNLSYTLIPDINFEKKLISLGLDSGTVDGKVLTESISGIKQLTLNESTNKITDLTGIEDFTSLESLDCSSGAISKLDVSKNLNLKSLICGTNTLTTLDVSKNLNLKTLDASYNNLTSIDVSKNLALDYLNVSSNTIATIDISKNGLLTSLAVRANKLTSLDVSKNLVLTALEASNNKLTSIDVIKNTTLTYLAVANNQLTATNVSKNITLKTLDVSSNKIETLDVSLNPALTSLYVRNNLLESLNLKNGKNNLLTNNNVSFTSNSNLTCILVDDVNYANTNWLNKKDAIATYNTECTSELTLPANNFAIETKSESCLGENNGEISIVAKTAFAYTATINDKSYTFTNNSLKVASLVPGVYKIKITIPDVIFEQNFNITIAKGATIIGKSSITSKKVDVEITEGTAPFTVLLNGNEQFQTAEPNFSIALNEGGLLEIKTSKACEGVYAKKIKTTDILGALLFAYPNPTTGIFEIEVPTSKNEVIIELYNFVGQLVSSKNYVIENGTAKLSLENQPSGIYAAKIYLETPEFIKIIKK